MTRAIPLRLLVPGALLCLLAAFLLLPDPGATARLPALAILAFALCVWRVNEVLASVPVPPRAIRLAVPFLFGLTLLLIWEVMTRTFAVPVVLLPPPSMIAARFAASTDILWADFVQTFLKGALIGYALGCGAAFLTALAIDRSPFLQRGLLPVGNLVAALPIIGIAPIMVMWFGFDWPSKAAVVVVMVFFPMLVNTVEGLRAADRMQADLMRTWAASYWQTMVKLRLPAAAPFLFNGLKICSTLALIGAIVAEFFGTPIVGMGFRISTEVGRMNIDMVWASIAVAALAGSAFYGAVVLVERAVTFWHPSVRGSGR
jgi:NitT/TauT family transport system permease protein